MEPQEIAEQVRLCAGCPKMCRHRCPTFFAWRSDSPTPHGRALLIHYENTETRDIDSRGAEVLYQCLQCSQCLTWCLPGVDIAEIVESMRKSLVSRDLQPAGLNSLRESIESHHNPFREDHDERNQWLGVETQEKTDIIYFAGCTSSYREKEIARATVSLLHHLNYSVQVAPDEWCCGSPLVRTGFEEASKRVAQHNADLLNSLDADEILVTCPGCYKTLTNDYADYGINLNKPVVHLSEFLEHRLDSLPKTDFETNLTYHDPCHLGRHSEIYDAPRSVIETVTGKEVVEMDQSRENAMCCGNGAGLRTLFPDYAHKIGKERIRQAKETGAGILVSTCPFCKNMLNAEADYDLEVLDLSELVEFARSREFKSA
ncbi:(Fe-S)-binding protein [Candidatus Thorarchaeota archaeon]|nr:MAG: (Fe-S)-binding protein [Candidatus Thorarchaeota archaeon]